ncbi:MAG TPA: 50S ribosomal protein L11 methyltransferase [Solirubrobacteraceae bacterium]|nr:50S ribosomal protein L11 methyltransferase [Solirubrobacteraceae bacterium]
MRVRREHAELVLAELLELAPAGVEELPERAGVVEFAVYGAPGELPALPDLEAAAGDALVEISTSEIPDDWSERWRAFHRPVRIEAPCTRGPVAVPAIGIRPPWLDPDVWGPGDLREIVIDPGQAFGTGSHATTRLCLELLLALAAQDAARGTVVDVGTGSGVLAIAAALLGFSPVFALDHERESVDAAAANAVANRVELDVRRFDLRAGPPPLPDREAASSGCVVLANLLAPLLETLARTLPAAPTHVIAGGLLHEQVDDVARAFARHLGLREHARRARGEWSALWLCAA